MQEIFLIRAQPPHETVSHERYSPGTEAKNTHMNNVSAGTVSSSTEHSVSLYSQELKEKTNPLVQKTKGSHVQSDSALSNDSLWRTVNNYTSCHPTFRSSLQGEGLLHHSSFVKPQTAGQPRLKDWRRWAWQRGCLWQGSLACSALPGEGCTADWVSAITHSNGVSAIMSSSQHGNNLIRHYGTEVCKHT